MGGELIGPRAFASNVMSAEDAAGLISADGTVGMSGFTGAGYPKQVPGALARRIADAAQRGSLFTVNVWDRGLDGARVGWGTYQRRRDRLAHALSVRLGEPAKINFGAKATGPRYRTTSAVRWPTHRAAIPLTCWWKPCRGTSATCGQARCTATNDGPHPTGSPWSARRAVTADCCISVHFPRCRINVLIEE